MRGYSKFLTALFVCALCGAFLAGCSGQSASSSASSASASATASASAASGASTEDLIKELEGLLDSSKPESVTIDIQSTISVDASAVAGASAGSQSSSAASGEPSMSEITTSVLIKDDSSSDPEKAYLSLGFAQTPFEMYLTGEDVVIVAEGQAFSGKANELADLGMGDYTSAGDVMNKNGAAEFATYKDAVESITKETVNGESVYTVVVDPSKIANDEATNPLASFSVTGEPAKINLSYTLDANGKMTSAVMEMSGDAFTFTTNAKFSDYGTTVVPDAPEATGSLSDLKALMEAEQAKKAA